MCVCVCVCVGAELVFAFLLSLRFGVSVVIYSSQCCLGRERNYPFSLLTWFDSIKVIFNQFVPGAGEAGVWEAPFHLPFGAIRNGTRRLATNLETILKQQQHENDNKQKGKRRTGSLVMRDTQSDGCCGSWKLKAGNFRIPIPSFRLCFLSFLFCFHGFVCLLLTGGG